MMTTLLRSNILHRGRRGLLACALVVCVSLAGGWAQRTRRVSQGPRAMGVLEVDAKGRARLIPISLFIGGKFYDAGLYHATPRPFALQPETLYEGEQNGESVGLFTVTGAQQTNSGWIGLGQWRLNTAELEKKPAKSAPAPVDTTDERPVLRRPGAQGETSEAKPPSNQAGKPQSTAEPPPAAKPQPPPPPVEEDRNRPVLRRGKPTAPEPQDEQPVATPKPAEAPRAGGVTSAAAADRATSPVSQTGVQTLTAVSDASGPELRPYKYQMSAEEEQKYRRLMTEMAYNAVRKFAAARPQFRPEGPVGDVLFTALDPNSNNEAVFIFSASVPEFPAAAARTGTPPGAARYYVTAVARVDLYGELRPLFSQVTDTSHLDVYPRMQLVGAVDADGNGAGELLFRQMQDRGASYSLYRVGMDRLWPLLETAQTRE